MNTIRVIFSCLVVLFLLIGCTQTNQVVPPTTVVHISPTRLATKNAPVALAGGKYQLTYVASYELNGTTYDGIFAMNVNCPDKTGLCMDTPILLFKIPKQKAIDSLQPYGEFLSYSWSPDGYKIAFCATGVDNRYDIFVSDWDGKNLKNITRSSSNECFPSWSIDNELTYTVCSEGRCRAVISDEKGLRVVQLPVVSTINVSTWTPDGKNILFVGEDNKAVYQIFITNPSGTDTRQITHTIENNIVPVLSSNGRNIFYQRMQIYETGNFNYNIFSIAIDGAIENPVTTGEELTSAMPSVAPFGNWIAFTKGQDSVYNIYVIDFDGKEQIQVTTGEDDKRVPGWRNIANP